MAARSGPIPAPLQAQEEKNKLKHLSYLPTSIPEPSHPNQRPIWVYTPLNYITNMRKKMKTERKAEGTLLLQHGIKGTHIAVLLTAHNICPQRKKFKIYFRNIRDFQQKEAMICGSDSLCCCGHEDKEQTLGHTSAHSRAVTAWPVKGFQLSPPGGAVTQFSHSESQKAQTCHSARGCRKMTECGVQRGRKEELAVGLKGTLGDPTPNPSTSMAEMGSGVRNRQTFPFITGCLS